MFKIVASAVASIFTFVFGLIVVSTDSNLLDQFDDDPKQAAKEVMLHYLEIVVLYNFLRAVVVAALVEETGKYSGYRMMVTPTCSQATQRRRWLYLMVWGQEPMTRRLDLSAGAR